MRLAQYSTIHYRKDICFVVDVSVTNGKNHEITDQKNCYQIRNIFMFDKKSDQCSNSISQSKPLHDPENANLIYRKRIMLETENGKPAYTDAD